jgi:hypothetical protein
MFVVVKVSGGWCYEWLVMFAVVKVSGWLVLLMVGDVCSG